MNKSGYFAVIIMVLLVMVGCENTLNKEVTYSEKNASGRGCVDPLPFIDVSDRRINAFEIRPGDFSIVNGQYRNQRSGSLIIFNEKLNTVRVILSGCDVEKYKTSNISFEYEYIIKAAGNDLLYLYPKNTREVKVCINGTDYSSKDFDQFSLIIPLYGFGQGRMEVSNHLKGITLVPDGTYWKR